MGISAKHTWSKETPLGGQDRWSSVQALVLVGGIYVASLIPSNLSIFIGPKIVADPAGFSEQSLRCGQCLYYVGWAVSGVVTTPLSDRIGRKPVLYTVLATGLAMVFCGATTHSQVLFVASFFGSGLCASGAYIAYVLAGETTSGPVNEHLASIVNSLYSLLLGVVAYVCTRITADVDWRLELAAWYCIGYLPLLVLGPFFAHDSPALAKRSKVDAGQKMAPGDLAEPAETAPASPLAMLFGWGLLATTLCTCCCWSAVVLAYYALSFSARNLSDDLGLNMMLFSIADLMSYAAGTSAASAVGGARRLQLGSFFLAGVFMLAMEGLSPGSKLLLLGAVAARLFVNFAYNSVMMLVVEHFPAECRTSATGLANFCARLVTVAAPLCASLPLPTLFRLMGVVMLFACYSTWWLPGPEEGLQSAACRRDWRHLPASWCECIFSTLLYGPQGGCAGDDSWFPKGRTPLLAVDSCEPVDPCAVSP